MKAFRLPIRGDDHTNRHSVILTGPHFTDIDGDEFLACGDRPLNDVPILENLDFERARIANGVHVENLACGRDAMTCKENADAEELAGKWGQEY